MTMTSQRELEHLLIVSHTHDDGSPAGGYTVTDGRCVPWWSLGDRIILDVHRVVDADGAPAYAVDHDDGRRAPTLAYNIFDAIDIYRWEFGAE